MNFATFFIFFGIKIYAHFAAIVFLRCFSHCLMGLQLSVSHLANPNWGERSQEEYGQRFHKWKCSYLGKIGKSNNQSYFHIFFNCKCDDIVNVHSMIQDIDKKCVKCHLWTDACGHSWIVLTLIVLKVQYCSNQMLCFSI